MKSCAFVIVPVVVILLSAAGCDGPGPTYSAPPQVPPADCTVQTERHVEGNFGPGGIGFKVDEKKTTVTRRPESQPAQPLQPEPFQPLPPLPPMREAPRGSRSQAPGVFGVEFVQTEFCMYG